MSEPLVARFHRWNPSLPLGAFGSVIACVQLAGAATTSYDMGTRILSIVLAVLVGAMAVRAFRSSTMLIGEGHLTVRTLLRRRRWPLEQVLGASIETGIIGVAMYVRRFPVIHLVNGDDYECREITTSRARSGELAPIVEAINHAVRR